MIPVEELIDKQPTPFWAWFSQQKGFLIPGKTISCIELDDECPHDSELGREIIQSWDRWIQDVGVSVSCVLFSPLPL